MDEKEKRDIIEQRLISAVIQQPLYAKISSIRPEMFSDRFLGKVWKVYLEEKIEPLDVIQVLDKGNLWNDPQKNDLVRLSSLGDMTFGSFSYYEERLLNLYKKELIQKKVEEFYKGSITEDDLQKVIETPITQELKPCGYEVQDILKAIEKAPAPLSTGFESLDEKVKFYPTDLIILKGGTKNGKTTFAMNMLERQLRLGKRCLYITYEIPTYDRFIPFLSSIYTNHRYSTKVEELNQVVKLLNDVGENLYLLPKPENVISLEQTISKLRQIKLSSGLDFVFIDFDQLITSEKRFDGEERRVSYIAKTLKLLADELKIVVVLLSQVNAEGKTRWSTEKENIASAVLSIELEPASNILTLWIPLNRYGSALIKDNALRFTIDWETRKVNEE